MGKYSINPQRGFFPQPVYLIGTYKKDGTPNFALITWLTFCSVEPPMLLFSSRGKKLTREAAVANGQFSANLVTVDMMAAADYFGMHSGYDTDKCAGAGVKVQCGAVLPVPILEASPWVFECELVKVVNNGEASTYFGKVVNIVADTKLGAADYGNLDMQRVDPLIYAPGAYYCLGAQVGKAGFTKKGSDKRSDS